MNGSLLSPGRSFRSLQEVSAARRVRRRAALLRSVWQKATADLNGRELVIDLEGLTAISEDGENTLLELMQEGAGFHSSGAFTKQFLERLACTIRGNVQEAKS
jgi:hypothetical protein